MNVQFQYSKSMPADPQRETLLLATCELWFSDYRERLLAENGYINIHITSTGNYYSFGQIPEALEEQLLQRLAEMYFEI